jgi:SAM-dependent methyltransferase
VKPLDQPQDLQAYYRDPGVVGTYLDRRTAQPFNGFLHASQVAFINGALRERRPARVLEIAPGPGRLTADVDPLPIIALDASAAMLSVARERLRAKNRPCVLLQGDSLKLIRHFQIADRMRLYGEIRRVLGPGGMFVLDVQNRAVSLPHRLAKGVDSYRIYDELYDAPEVTDELASAGFAVRRMGGIARHFGIQRYLNRLRRLGLGDAARRLISVIERLPGGAPSTWMVLAEVRP